MQSPEHLDDMIDLTEHEAEDIQLASFDSGYISANPINQESDVNDDSIEQGDGGRIGHTKGPNPSN